MYAFIQRSLEKSICIESHQFFFLIFLISLHTFAQKEKTQALGDFSGTWILDEKKSFRISEDKEYFEDYTLVISQNEAETKIVQTYSFRGKSSEYTIKLFTDKRGEENKYAVRRYAERTALEDFYWLEDVNLKSKTFAKNGKLVREGSCSSACENPFVVKETYNLSKDGKTLTITTEKTFLKTIVSGSSILDRESSSNTIFSNSSSSATYKFVFNKKE